MGKNKDSEFKYLGLEGLSDDQLDILTRSTQNGFKKNSEGRTDLGFYDGKGSDQYNRSPQGILSNIWGGLDGKRDPETDPSLLFKATFDGDYKNVDSNTDIADMFMRLKDERTRRQIEGMMPDEAPAAPAPDPGPELLDDDRPLQEETQAAIDRATEYEAELPNFGTDIFGERNTGVYGYDYDWQNGIRPEGTPGRKDEEADRFANKYKLDIANNMSPSGRKSAVGAPVNVASGISLFGR